MTILMAPASYGALANAGIWLEEGVAPYCAFHDAGGGALAFVSPNGGRLTFDREGNLRLDALGRQHIAILCQKCLFRLRFSGAH